MTVPGRVAAATLLFSPETPPWFVTHARAIAEVAGLVAARVPANGIAVDRPAVEAAGLLHEVDKMLATNDLARRIEHGLGSASWLTRRGHPKLGRAVAGHPVTCLIDARFASWRRRYPDGWDEPTWRCVRARVERLEADGCRGAGIEPADVRHLPWTADAFQPSIGNTAPR